MALKMTLIRSSREYRCAASAIIRETEPQYRRPSRKARLLRGRIPHSFSPLDLSVCAGQFRQILTGRQDCQFANLIATRANGIRHGKSTCIGHGLIGMDRVFRRSLRISRAPSPVRRRYQSDGRRSYVTKCPWRGGWFETLKMAVPSSTSSNIATLTMSMPRAAAVENCRQ